MTATSSAAQPPDSDAAASKPPRLAVIDQSSNGVLDDFLALLNVKLDAGGEAQLVERAELRRILDEQRIRLLLGDPQLRESAIRTGRLAGANALALFSTGAKQADGALPVELHLLETRLGFITADHSFELAAGGANLEQAAEEQARIITSQLRRLDVDPLALHLLGVSEFFNDEISSSWNWLGPAVARALEQRLALYPGVLLLERQRAGALIRERETTAELPPGVQAGAILIEGAYVVRWSDRTLILTVTGKEGSQTLFSFDAEGPLDHYGAACDRAAQRIMDDLVTAGLRPVMDAAAEAALLEREVEQYYKRREFARALPAAESAAALMPDSAKYLQLYQKVKARSNFDDSIFILAQRICALDQGEHAKQSIELIMNIFDMISISEDNLLDPEKSPVNQKSIALTHDCLELARRTFPEGSPELQSLEDKFSVFFVHDIDEAIELTRNRAARITNWFESRPPRPYANRVYQQFVSVMTRWLDDPQSMGKAFDYMQEATQAPDPEVRMLALYAMIYFHEEIQPNIEQRYRYALEFVPLAGKAEYNMILPLIEKRYHDDEAESEKRERDILSQVLQARIAERNFSRDASADGKVVQRLAHLNEKHGNREEAIRLLQIYLPGKHERKMREAFIQQLADYGIESPDPEESTRFEPEIYLQASDEEFRNLGRGVKIRRMRSAPDGSLLLLLSSDFYSKIHLSKMDPRTKQLLYTQEAKVRIEYSTNTGNKSIDLEFGPAMAQVDNDIYLGFFDYGLIIFHSDGTIEQWNEKNGLPTNQIRDLQAVDGMLYAQIGRIYGDSGLMELNPNERKVEIVFTNRRSPLKPELQDRHFRNFICDPERNVLWLLFLDNRGMYEFDPRARVIREVSTELMQKVVKGTSTPDPFRHLRIDGDRIYFLNGHGVYRLNLRTLEDELLCYSYNLATRKWSIGESRFKGYSFFPIEDDLIVLGFDQFYLFRDSIDHPIKIPSSRFVAETKKNFKARDFVRTPQGLLVLTENAIYRFAAIK